MQVYLSYTLAPGDVVWPGEPTVEIHQFTSVEKDGYNSYKTLLPNHHGTHYDAPNHFNAAGPKITELPMDYFWFDRVCVLDLPKEPGQGVTREDLEARRQQIGDAQLLLFKTGLPATGSSSPGCMRKTAPSFTRRPVSTWWRTSRLCGASAWTFSPSVPPATSSPPRPTGRCSAATTADLSPASRIWTCAPSTAPKRPSRR